MIKAVEYTFCGKTVWLIYTMSAMLGINEKFGEASELIKQMDVGSPEGREVILTAFSILSEAGNACRRHFSEQDSFVPTVGELRDCSTLHDLAAMRDAVINAICIGVGRDVPDAEGIDLDQLEFDREHEKKTR